MLHAIHHFAPGSVLPVEKVGVAKADEELVASTVWVIGHGHATGTFHMRDVIEFCLYVRQYLLGPPALGHEPFYDTVEDSVVIKSLVNLR